MGELRILLGDDHTVLRHGLRKILEERRDWRVVAEAGNGRDAVREALALTPDVAILDIGMPLLNGIEATRQIVRRAPSVHVLILSMHSDQAYVTQAVQAGARGYLLKESAGAELLEAIATLAAGKSYFSQSVAQVVFDDYVKTLSEKGITDPYDSLSEREREVLQLVAEGRSSKEIAELLSISPATVETHRAHLLQKLRLHNTVEVVRYASRRGIIQ
ncbi:MAG TPA: response regulator transcription factor [Vicinamibacterales bacterium]|jgi:DNA-binding NarL/FixJ family response regulator|nr:response regulator transcription factor [Vicinamibacterales bacterium]